MTEQKRKPIHMIMAAQFHPDKLGIGNKGALPWPGIQEDMKHFRHVTTEAAKGKTNLLIMGRKTWESLPAKAKPFKNRACVVLSKKTYTDENYIIETQKLPVGVYNDFGKLYEDVTDGKHEGFFDKIWVIGGAEIYLEAVRYALANNIEVILELTEVYKLFECDTFLPDKEFYDHFTMINHTNTFTHPAGFNFAFLRLCLNHKTE